MNSYSNIVWWIIYTIFAIYLQTKVQGFDALLPGFIIILQEGRIRQGLWLIPIYFIIQEGMGTMAFGTIFLCYSSVVIIYLTTRWLFEVESLPFILLLSFTSSFVHYWIIIVMGNLQDMHFDVQKVFDANIYQAFLTPIIWYLAYFSRRGFRYAAQS